MERRRATHFSPVTMFPICIILTPEEVPLYLSPRPTLPHTLTDCGARRNTARTRCVPLVGPRGTTRFSSSAPRETLGAHGVRVLEAIYPTRARHIPTEFQDCRCPGGPKTTARSSESPATLEAARKEVSPRVTRAQPTTEVGSSSVGPTREPRSFGRSSGHRHVLNSRAPTAPTRPRTRSR